MKKYIRGTFELEQNVTDLDEFEKQHKTMMTNLPEWLERHDVKFVMGTSDDNTYLCEYTIVGATASYCKGLCSELKQLLKTEFPKIKLLYQESGNLIR